MWGLSAQLHPISFTGSMCSSEIFQSQAADMHPSQFRRRRDISWKHTGVFTALEDRTWKQPQDVLEPGIKDCQAKCSLSTGLRMLSSHTLVSVPLLPAHWRVAKMWPFPNALSAPSHSRFQEWDEGGNQPSIIGIGNEEDSGKIQKKGMDLRNILEVNIHDTRGTCSKEMKHNYVFFTCLISFFCLNISKFARLFKICWEK